MSTYISELGVSLDEDEEQQLQSGGFKKINVDLNKKSGGKDIYLWYKHGSVPITKVQISFKDKMAVGLINAGYTKINKDLNAAAGGSDLYLWFSKGSGEFNTPIVHITVTGDADDEAPMFGAGWERVTCDLNRKAGGNYIHIWLKRKEQTYICDVIATDSYGLDTDHFKAGYIRVDEDTNRGAQGSDVFIWFRQTTDPEKGLKDLQVSITDSQYQEYQQKNYQPVNVNLNEGAKGVQEYLWYKKEGSKNPIKAITLLLNKDVITDYMRAGVQVIKKDLNTGNKGSYELLCFYQ
ncbi:Basigin [Dissostichus eleginoides]|uniref:Basigin n=1 Tax=Dissostichus eleginoides TaxID=100907 RepID=A0AAD9BX65_DISEL|nr:Basigin [Dissostichus eleginoides]